MLLALLLAACTATERQAPVSTPATVPAVTGSYVRDAVRLLESAGLQVTGAGVDLGRCPTATVLRQDTPEGTELVRGSTVELSVTSCPP
jgi:beta-lactam-binding protein with PASTA domain